MKVIMIGCEYAGKTTLAAEISKWIAQTMRGARGQWHDHFVLPHVVDPGPEAEEEEAQILTLKPTLLETFQRYQIQYHFAPAFYQYDDHLLIDWYYGDAVYAPLYYGFGGAGEYADRQQMARAWDAQVMAVAPDTVLVLVKPPPKSSGSACVRVRVHALC